MADMQKSFRFGVEIELLLGCRKKSYNNWKSLAKDVSKRLLKAGIANNVHEDGERKEQEYLDWSIVPEVTVPSNPAKNLCWSQPPVRRCYHTEHDTHMHCYSRGH